MNSKFLIVLVLCYTCLLQSQNECSKWYFGNNVALDFMTNPPGQPGNSVMQTVEACASIAAANGNLLFYTNGENVWNSSHILMANGSGLLGNVSASQGALILKQPGSTDKYYLFTLDDWTGNNGLRYSVVDMSLAAGMGSVTTKNILLLNQKPSETICSIKHCNNTDMWIVGIDPPNNRLFSFLLSSVGVSSVPVTTPVSLPPANLLIGQIKSSPNGTKVCSALTYSNNRTSVRLYDFDPQTGVFSNEVILHDTSAFINNIVYRYYGCEFSPDGSKLYSARISGKIYQWDLCPVNATGIKQSRFLLPDTNLLNAYSMQLAPDGKIYITSSQQQNLSIINQPDLAGSACNYVSNALPITSGTLTAGLPNFPSYYFFQKKPLVFTNTLSCGTAAFNPSPLSCGSPTVQAYVWNFGEAQIPAQNTSTLQNPAHTYTATGTYTVTLVRQFACYSDTISQVLTVTGIPPNIQHNAPGMVCLNETHTISASGAATYTWSTNETASQIVITPTVPGTYTNAVTGTNTQGCSATKTLSISVSNCVGVEQQNALPNIKIYPNPFQNALKIESPEEIQITFCTQLATAILQQKVTGGSSEIDLQKLPQGLYYLRVETKKGQTAYYKMLKVD